MKTLRLIIRPPKTICLLVLILLLSGCEEKPKIGLPIDGDGNEYDTIVIGTQTWLSENLKTTKYRNGDPIYLVTDDTKWSAWQTGAYCWYENSPVNKEAYGALYNRKAASSDFLCPSGWHVPSEADWNELITFLGGQHYAGGKLKETGTLHWISQSQGTTNETGFTALPGGCRYLDGTFRDLREYGYWWMSDLNRFIKLNYSNAMSGEGGWNGVAGYSIRCVKDK